MKDQEAFDEAFDRIVVDDSLDDVIAKLAAVGVKVEEWQRGIVFGWLDRDDPKVPLELRLAVLKQLLARSMKVRPS